MQKHQLYINLLTLTSALALSACVEEVVYVVNPDVPEVGEKTPIELSVGGIDAPEVGTRAVVTDGTTDTDFGGNTKVFILMQSEKDATIHDGYEYKGDRGTPLYTVSRGDVVYDTDHTKLVFDDINQKYWDDAHARSSQLTLWAFAQRVATATDGNWKSCTFQKYSGETPSLEEASAITYNTTANNDWSSTPKIYPAIFSWSVGNGEGYNQNQDANTLIYQDLLFSNNIANYEGNTKVPDGSRTDNRLKYNFGTKKFPASTELKFYHAMSKITIKIKAGSGFKADGTDFKLKETSGKKTIDLLHGFNTRGLFNIKDGEFQTIHRHDDITIIPLTKTEVSKTNPYYTLEALVIPNIHQFMFSQRTSDHPNLKDDNSRFVDSSSEVMLQFTIDNNTYKITSDVLFDAVTGKDHATTKTDNGKYVPLEAGKNYEFTFTIGKKVVENISAKLVDWETIQADPVTPTNAYVSVSVKNSEGTLVEDNTPTFDLYRTSAPVYSGVSSVEGYNAYADYTWEKSYEKSSSLAESSINGVYQTEWFWPDNKTFYHFRTVSPKNTSVTVGTSSNGNNDFIEIAGGSLITVGGVGPSAIDFIWGAPFKTSSPDPDLYSFSTGYCNNSTKADGQLYKAIGATNDNITLIQHHMTSQVFIHLETVTGDAAVNLTDATVQLFNIATSAKLYLGNGLVTGYSNIGTIDMTTDVHAAVSPIPAYDFSYGVIPQTLSEIGIKIATSDGNVYIIENLSTIKESGKTTAVDAWLPGKKYYYKFVLKKKAVEEISATIVDWETVSTEEEEVQIQ